MVRRVLIKAIKRWIPYVLVIWLLYMWINSGGGAKRISTSSPEVKPARQAQAESQVENKVVYQHHPSPEPSLAPGPAPSLDPALAPSPGIVSVVVLAYERTGASYVTQLLNKNPGTFYVVDPVDGVYSAMYATKPGRMFGADTSWYWNGTERLIPEYEVASLSSALTSLLSCDLDHVPTEVLGHMFFQQYESAQPASRHYIDCLRESETDIGLICGPKLSKMCPEVFGFNDEAQERCLWALAKFRNEAKMNKTIDKNTWMPLLPVNQTTNTLDIPRLGLKRGSISIYKDPYTDSGQRHYKDYIHCVDKQRKIFADCLPELQTMCDKSTMRVIKTTRLTMATVESMLQRNPNLRLIHVLRDPRAVVASRSASVLYRSHHARTNLTKEARGYCRSVARDLEVRRRLEVRFPARFLEVITERLRTHRRNETERIFRFLGQPMSRELQEFLSQNMPYFNVNGTKFSPKWKTLLDEKTEKEIKMVCKDVFEKYKQFWD